MAFAVRPAVSHLIEEYNSQGDLTPTQEQIMQDGLEPIASWRKHANLNEFMSQLWEERTGNAEFNCNYLKLTSEDIDDLEDATLKDELPHGVGFFWGETQDWHKEETLEFIASARNAIAQGKDVFYYCWW